MDAAFMVIFRSCSSGLESRYRTLPAMRLEMTPLWDTRKSESVVLPARRRAAHDCEEISTRTRGIRLLLRAHGTVVNVGNDADVAHVRRARLQRAQRFLPKRGCHFPLQRAESQWQP
jgi:hypothetical protein